MSACQADTPTCAALPVAAAAGGRLAVDHCAVLPTVSTWPWQAASTSAVSPGCKMPEIPAKASLRRDAPKSGATVSGHDTVDAVHARQTEERVEARDAVKVRIRSDSML